MIVVQTPLRISLFGGGTDFPAFFAEEGGCVLCSAIDKYIFVIVKQRFDDYLRVGYTRTEIVEQVGDIQHELIREALRKVGVQRGIEVTTMGDIPSEGSGLGSSSTVTVGALNALYAYRGETVLAERLAREACEIEISTLHKPIGIQDQYIAAYGDLRFFEFAPDGQVCGRRLEVSATLRRQLNDSLLLFYTGITRQASSILAEQQRNLPSRGAVLRELKQMAYCARDELQAGRHEAVGRLLHESWVLKKQLAGAITNSTIDAQYEAARRAGATGGKIAGAGGGGFLLLYCPVKKQEAVRQALHGMAELPFRLEADGSKVIFNYRR